MQLTISVCFPGLCYVLLCGTPSAKKVKSNKRVVSTKSTRIAIILNPPVEPLRQQPKTSASRRLVFLQEKEYTSELLCSCLFCLLVRVFLWLQFEKKWVMD